MEMTPATIRKGKRNVATNRSPADTNSSSEVEPVQAIDIVLDRQLVCIKFSWVCLTLRYGHSTSVDLPTVLAGVPFHVRQFVLAHPI